MPRNGRGLAQAAPFDLGKVGGNPWHDRAGRFAFGPADGRGAGASAKARFGKHRLAVRKFVNRTLHVKDRTEAHTVGGVEQTARIKAQTGHDLTGHTLIMENTALSHSLRHHGDPATEAARGQEAISRDDFQHVPEVIQTGAPSPFDMTRRGAPGITFIKSIGSAEYHVGTEVRAKAKQLAFKTMWKRPVK